MEVSQQAYMVIIIDEEGRPIITAENNILLCDNATQGLLSIPFTLNIANEFGIAHLLQTPHKQQENLEENEPSISSDAEITETETETEIHETHSKIWTTENTLYLIEMVQKFDKQFSSGVKKNFWLKVAECCKHLHKSLNAKHCETKWKSLIRTYKNIILSNNTSRQKKRYWEFFDVIHAIMFKKPEIASVATCSSLGGLRITAEKDKQNEGKNQNSAEENKEADSSRSEMDEESGKENFESGFSKKRKQKNSEVEKRHREKMQRLDRFNDLFERMIDKLPEK